MTSPDRDWWKNSQEQKQEKPSEKLAEVLRKANVEFTTLKAESGGEFDEAVLLKHAEVPREKMLRVYRGINHMDDSILRQTPYASRSERDGGKPEEIHELRDVTHELAQNPTYENLLKYMEQARQFRSGRELRRMEEDFTLIEDGILDGMTMRTELKYKQLQHNGGHWAESGLSPYISASHSPYDAAGYGQGGLMVIDIPISEIEDYSGKGEVSIKGALDKKYITAILPRERKPRKESEEKIHQDLYKVLQKVFANARVPQYNPEESEALRQADRLRKDAADKEQWKIDVVQVRQRRVAKLKTLFPDQKLDMEELRKSAKEKGIDILSKAMQDIYDHYADRMKNNGGYSRNIDEEHYYENTYGAPKKFDREHINESMLLKLRGLVQRLEDLEEDRKARRRET